MDDIACVAWTILRSLSIFARKHEQAALVNFVILVFLRGWYLRCEKIEPRNYTKQTKPHEELMPLLDVVYENAGDYLTMR